MIYTHTFSFILADTMKINRLREINKVAFDTMVMIDLIESGENVRLIFEEWRNSLKKTEFFVSSNVIKETYGVLINKKHIDPADAKERINEIKKTFNMKEMQYDKEVDNKEGIRLFREAEKRYPEVAFKDPQHLVNDSRIVAHMKRDGINLVYSREELFRKVAEIAGLEARNFITDKYRKKAQ